jgi:DNA polymerase-1
VDYNVYVEIMVARTDAEIDIAFERLSGAGVLGCDTETSGLSARYGKLYSIQFSDGDFSVLIPYSEGVEPGVLSGLLADIKIVKIFHNAKFDLDFLRENGIATQNVFDTMIAEKVLTKGANQSASLAETLYRYFAVDLEKSHRSKFTKAWDGIWTADLVEYALSDVVHLPQLMKQQQQWLDRLGLTEAFASQMQKIVESDASLTTDQDS